MPFLKNVSDSSLLMRNFCWLEQCFVTNSAFLLPLAVKRARRALPSFRWAMPSPMRAPTSATVPPTAQSITFTRIPKKHTAKAMSKRITIPTIEDMDSWGDTALSAWPPRIEFSMANTSCVAAERMPRMHTPM